MSWSRIGILLRRRIWSWDQAVDASFEGKVAVVTGGSSGIGKAAALALAQAGATVGIVGKDPARTELAAAEIAERSPIGTVWAEVADLGSIEETESLAERIRERTHRVDALVHCAGVLEHQYVLSEDGIETTAAVHVVGPHVLTSRIAPLLARSAPSRVVWVSSGGMYAQRLEVDGLEPDPNRYRGTVAYAQAKRAQVVLSGLWNDRLETAGISSFAMHPGWVNTAALSDGLPSFSRVLRPILRDPSEGADTVVWLAGGSAGSWAEPGEPGIWLDRRRRKAQRWPIRGQDPDEARKLWDWCEAKAAHRTIREVGG
jgi:dehydrogenase/reductase SDR family protein 12